MKISTRNQFPGTVKSVQKGAVNAEVILDVGGAEIAAIITNRSVDSLGLEPGREAIALVKAPWVILSTETGLRTSARNQWSGTVTRCQTGAVNGEVEVELAFGQRLVAIVTNDSIQSLGLKAGVPVSALIKASHIVIAVRN